MESREKERSLLGRKGCHNAGRVDAWGCRGDMLKSWRHAETQVRVEGTELLVVEMQLLSQRRCRSRRDAVVVVETESMVVEVESMVVQCREGSAET